MRRYVSVCICVCIVVHGCDYTTEREREREREKLKNKVIQIEEFDIKESQRFNVSVLMNRHQKIIISSDIRSPMDFSISSFLSPDNGS